jgi:ATP-dependent helicase/nuclease subunit A
LNEDLAIRAEVLDPERSFIVQAPAGSGKTELLTQRILGLLARVGEPEQILAITFTRKAAGEMRERLLDSLRRAAGQPCPEAAHQAINWRLARAVLEQDRQQEWNLLSHPGRLEIRTMDSLNARLVRQMPVMAAFGGTAGIVDDAEEAYRSAARATLQMVEEEAVGEPIAALLRWLDNDMGRVEQLVTEMLGHRDQWLPHIVGGEIQRELLEQTLRVSVEGGLERVAALLEESLGRAGVAELVELAAAAAEVVRDNPKQPKVVFCLGLERLPATDAESLLIWQGVVSLFLKGDGGFRLTPRSWTKNEGFPADAEGKRLKAVMLALSQQIAALPAAAAAVQQVPQLPPLGYEEPQWAVVEALFQLLLVAQANLMVWFEEQGQVDHTEVAQRALRALGEEDNPTPLALRLDHQIHHILVDEFQDTSHGQFELLSRLSAEWSQQDRERSLFLVGDPMQSIYRFRHAEVGLFIKAIEDGLGGHALEYRQLSANFRSESGLVEWVNQSFSRMFPLRSDRFSGAIHYAPSIATRGATTTRAVTLHPALIDDRESEAREVVALVQRSLSERQSAEDKVAILVRSRTHLQQITQQLYCAGIGYRAVEIESLGDRPVVRDLLTLTRALLHPADREAWLALLRAPWCGVDLDDLLALVENEPQRTLLALMEDERQLAQLSEAGRGRLTGLREVMNSLLSERGEASLVRWIERGWRRLGGAVIHREWGERGQQAQRESDAFFELLAAMTQGGEVVDLQRLRERLQRQNVRSAALQEGEVAPSVEVMTIHKSKGLQFDTVILPGLGRRPRGSSRRLLHWLEVPQTQQQGEASMQLLLSPIRPAEQRVEADLLGKYVQKIEQARGRNELVRLLYVAITRAERQLHLLGAVRLTGKGELASPVANSLLEQLWPVVEERYKEMLEQSDPALLLQQQERQQQEAQQVLAEPLRRLVSSWQPPIPPAAARPLPYEPLEPMVYQWGSPDAVHIGSVVHALLQWIAESGVESWLGKDLQPLQERVSRQLRQLGVHGESRSGATDRVLLALQQVLDDPQGVFFLTNHSEARSEWALSGLVDGELINITIDRTFVDGEGVRWIIDWKTSSHGGGGLEQFLDEEVARYTPQLQRYGEVLQQMESRPQKRVLYFPLHQLMREV